MKSARIAVLFLSQVMMVQICLVAKDSDFSKAITESKPDRHWSFDSFLPAKNVEASSGPTSTEYPAFGKVNPAVKMKNGGRIIITDPE